MLGRVAQVVATLTRSVLAFEASAEDGTPLHVVRVPVFVSR